MASFGIDIGTSSSSCALWENGSVVRLEIEDGCEVFPSHAYFEQDGTVSVGRRAGVLVAEDPDNGMLSAKRLFGMDAANPDTYGVRIAKNVRKDREGRFHYAVRGLQVYPEKIISSLLLKVKSAIDVGYSEDEMHRCVITVPVYYSAERKERMRELCTAVGLRVVEAVEEPVAAVLAYGFSCKGARKNVLVADLGGGTFDVAMVGMFAGTYQVFAVSGDGKLGGNDWDACISDWIMGLVKKRLDDFDASVEPLVRTCIERKAEELKIALSDRERVESLLELPVESVEPIELSLSRTQLDRMCAHLIERLDEPVERVIADSGVQKDEIDAVVMVGRASLMMSVQKRMAYLVGLDPLVTIDPGSAVAYGAALRAAFVCGEKSGVSLVDSKELSWDMRELLFKTAVLPSFPH